MTPPHGASRHTTNERNSPAQRMLPHAPQQQPAQGRLPMGYQQQGFTSSPTSNPLMQQHYQQQQPSFPRHTLPARPPRSTFQHPATYGTAARDEEEDLSGPLSLAGLRDVSFSQPAAGAAPASTMAPPPPTQQQRGAESHSSASPAMSRQSSTSGPPGAWQQASRKRSHARFDLRLGDLERGMIVHLKPNDTWGTGRHLGLVYAWKDAGYVEMLIGTSFAGRGMADKMRRIREGHEKARIGREYLRVGDGDGNGEVDRDCAPAYERLGLPVLRLRGGRTLKKPTYFRFVYRFHCELTDICKYADGQSLDNKYVLDEQSWELCQRYLEHRLPLIKKAEAEVRRQQREKEMADERQRVERERAEEKQRIQAELRQKVAEAARSLSAVSSPETE
ncbi:hypothetical protein SLS58_006301 [Diplodia intermedia]|uniref:Uncharacterized protein n=1 Tax=Diplodia intermedia TaxID=856260 RepID=A0ABR3TNX1_9PEZI